MLGISALVTRPHVGDNSRGERWEWFFHFAIFSSRIDRKPMPSPAPKKTDKTEQEWPNPHTNRSAK